MSSGGRSEQGGEAAAAAPLALPLVHHHHEGIELRVTVAFPQERRAQEVEALDELESMLAEAQQGPTASSVSVELGYEGQVLPLSEG